MYSICVAAHKGGVGKTTIAANLASALASEGAVLAVDLDPQGGLSGAFGTDDRKPTIYEVLRRRAAVATASRTSGVHGVTLLPADLDLAGAQVELAIEGEWHRGLHEALRPARSQFRWAVLDTPPGLDVLTQLALTASDAIIGVCPPDFMAIRSLPMLLETVEQARAIQPRLKLLGFTPTFVGTRTLHEREAAAHLAQHYGDLLLPAIPRRIAVADAHIAGRPVAVSDPTSVAALAFRELTQEVLRRAEASISV